MKTTLLMLIMTALFATAEGQTLTQQDKNTMRLAESEGYVTCNCALNKIMVKSTLWNQLPYQGKENFGAMYSIKCAKEKGNNLYFINIHDYYSGKQIAKYSKSYGFKVY